MKTAKSNRHWFAAHSVPLLLGAVLWAPSCSDRHEPAPNVGSETNFLTRCNDEAACAVGMSCLCGACTQTCEAAFTCETLDSGAECISVASRTMDPACPESAVSTFCDAPCAADAECKRLGSRHRCDRGFCRALSGSCQTGKTVAGEVILLGDTFVAASGELTEALEALARSSGSLGTDESYRDYSELLQNRLAPEAPGLFQQFTSAEQAGAVKVVLMNGGGADVLSGSCLAPVTPDCQLLQDVALGAEQLWGRMAQDGVEHVVFFFYPDYVGDASIKATVDALRPLLEERCANAPLPCHWLDLRTTFAGNYDVYILPDGRNPTLAGSQASAEAIWGLMQQRCIAQ